MTTISQANCGDPIVELQRKIGRMKIENTLCFIGSGLCEKAFKKQVKSGVHCSCHPEVMGEKFNFESNVTPKSLIVAT